MSNPQIIRTPKGERLAVIPLAEYERLREMATEVQDVRAYDEARRRLAVGADEAVPARIADRLLAGEHPIKVWRTYRGIKARTLAESAGISAAFLSQIERGEREGSLETMRRIATALGVSLDDLVPAG